MSLALVALAAAASFSCANPTHHDGDNLRCSNVPGSMRLQGIDAPEMPGGCRPGRACVDGDPYQARDYLRGLTAGKTLQCVQDDTDQYDRRIVNCTAGDENISCAMIASGLAVARYAPLDCSANDGAATAPAQTAMAEPATETASPAAPRGFDPPPVIVPADYQPPSGGSGLAVFVLIALALINAVTWALFATDKRRAQAGQSRERIAERTLLGWAMVGGSPAAWHAIHHLRHKSSKDSFKQALLLISGLQIGAGLGGLVWVLTG